jgi:hypothetical protein
MLRQTHEQFALERLGRKRLERLGPMTLGLRMLALRRLGL